MAFHALERLTHLHDGYRQAFSVAGLPLLLIQEKGQRYLLINQCPHQSAPLHNATISQGEIRCPAHGMRFSLQTGAAQGASSECLQFFPVSYQEMFIGLDL